MKKWICLLLLVCVTATASAESVTRLRITIDFTDVSREGLYTGEINESGRPDGFGVFEAVNTMGLQYYVLGEWKDGIMTGHGWKVSADGSLMIGAFENGNFIRGNYFKPSIPQAYQKE